MEDSESDAHRSLLQGGGSSGRSSGGLHHHTSVTIGGPATYSGEDGGMGGGDFGGAVSRLNLSTGLLERGVGNAGEAASLLNSGAYGMGIGGAPVHNAALSAAAGGLVGDGEGEGSGHGGRIELPALTGWGRSASGGESSPLTRGHVDSSSPNV